MFDFFSEVCENLNQVVSVVNWVLSTAWDSITSVSSNHAFTSFLSGVNALPASASALVLSVLAIKIFDFVRGR